MAGTKTRGGFARLAAVVKAERAKGGHVIYVHAGDTISPSLMSGFDKGEHIIDLLNMAPPDYFVPGNHEFDFGEEIFAKRMSEAKFPILAANLRSAQGKKLPGIEDNKLIEIEGIKIAIIGLTADDSPVKSVPGSLKFLADGQNRCHHGPRHAQSRRGFRGGGCSWQPVAGPPHVRLRRLQSDFDRRRS